MKKQLYIFDLDDTLVYCDEHIVVKDNNYDIKEYRSAEYFTQVSKPIQPMINWLKKIAITSDVHILTARLNFDNFENFKICMENLGVPMTNIVVHFAGKNWPRLITSESKAEIIANIVKENNYESISFFDDRLDNIEAVYKVINELKSNIVVCCHLVIYDKISGVVTQEYIV